MVLAALDERFGTQWPQRGAAEVLHRNGAGVLRRRQLVGGDLAEELVQRSIADGTEDNVTVIVVRVRAD